MKPRASPSRRRALAARVVVLFIAVCNPQCASLERTSRVQVELGGGYGRADVNPGCDGAGWQHEEHAQAHFVGGLRYEDESGIVFESSFNYLRGWLVEMDDIEMDDEIDPSRTPYTIVAAGATLGYDTKYIGTELGLHVAVGNHDVSLVPHFNMRFGNQRTIWGELRWGPEEPLLDPNLASIGFGLRHKGFGARLSLGGIVKPNLPNRGGRVAWDIEDDISFGVLPTISWQDSSGFGFVISAVAAEQFTVYGALTFDIGALVSAAQ